MTEEAANPYYQRQAKFFIDALFDKGYFRSDVKREEMKKIEDLLAFLYQSQTDIAVKCCEMLVRAKVVKADD